MDYEINFVNVNYINYIVNVEPRKIFDVLSKDIILEPDRIDDTDLINIKDNDYVSKSAISIYPNPASEQLHIAFSDETNLSEMQVVITNISGKELYREKIYAKHSSFDIDISALSSGTYFLNIIEDKGIKYSVKFIKY